MRGTLFKAALAGVFAALAAGSALAQTDQVKIGMIDDESSVYAGLGGKGSLIAIQMAIDDFGGKALGKPIEFKFADHLNKPDLGLNIADGWLQRENFTLITGGGSSAVLLAVQNAMKAMPTKTLMVTGASSMDFAGKNCTVNSIHATTNNYVLLAPTAPSLLKRGDDSWYILSSDNAGGKIAHDTASNIVTKGGGKITGSAYFPLEATDFSSNLLQAQASGAKVLALATSGSPLITLIKQAQEFGISKKMKIVLLAGYMTDIHALGLKETQGLVFSSIFYWDLNDSTRSFSERFAKQYGAPPDQMHAAAYTAVTHYLKAVEKAGTTDAQKVVPLMKQTPVQDALLSNGTIREDGMLVRPAYFVQVKTPAESKKPFDYYTILETIPADQAYMSAKDQGCPLVK